jgi:dihydrofolate reductase
MGELHVNMNITLDGVIQANGGPTEQDGDFEYAGWERPFWDAESGEQIIADVQASDALLLGRTTYDIFRAYWPGQTDEIGRAFDRVPKYVASRGTPELSWDTSTQITDVGAEVRDLRERHEQIHTWGSANLLQTLFRGGLVDRVNLVGVSGCARAGQEAVPRRHRAHAVGTAVLFRLRSHPVCPAPLDRRSRGQTKNTTTVAAKGLRR